MKRFFRFAKIWVGLLISVLFIWLAFRKTDPRAILQAIHTVHPLFLIFAVLIPFISHGLRAWRWRFLLYPIRPLKVPGLFSSLLIGYMANIFLPAHLGEIVRAYSLARKQKLPVSVIMASIVLDRIIDILSLIVLMGVTFFLFPFPPWLKQSGLIMLGFSLVLFAVLLWMRARREKATIIMKRMLGVFPQKMRVKLLEQLGMFLDGIVPLAKPGHYYLVAAQSLLIWLGYAFTFYSLFHAFGYTRRFGLSFLAALVLQVVTTISIVVPSSPGYVGTYHYLCQMALGLFGVPGAEALAFALVAHAVNFLPVLAAGMVCLFFEGMNLGSIRRPALEE